MIHVDNPKVPSDKPADELTFQIEPLRAPYFQIMQPVDDGWVEAGFVWTAGLSPTNAIENWYLYAATDPNDRERAPYRWPGYKGGTLLGATLRLVPATVPPGLNTGQLKEYLERTNNVTITHIKAAMAQGR
jgi:hypothetical protein